MNILALITDFVFKKLVLLHSGTILTKLKATLLLSIAASPFAALINTVIDWSENNSVYIQFVFGAIIIDHLLGSILHAFVKHDWDWKKQITGLLTKIGLVVAMGYLFEGVNYIVEEESFVKTYLSITLRLTVFLYPAGSAFINSAILTDGKFPPIGWMKRFKMFQENLKLSEIINKENKDEL